MRLCSFAAPCAALVGAMVVARPARAQAVLETPTHRIEVIGLKRWTIPMIRDSLARYAPQDSLTAHACAAVLRHSLKFADAAVTSWDRPDSTGRQRTIITVIEPQDSALVRYRRPASDSLPTQPRYAAAIAAFRARPSDFQRAIQDSAFLIARAAPTSAPEEAWRVPLEPVRALLVREATPEGRARAMRVLARDRNMFNRTMAVLVVSTAPEVDSTWWTLVEELRYPASISATTAEQVLLTLAYRVPRRIDWAPALDALDALVSGTNLFAHVTVLMVLARTYVAPTAGISLLRHGAPLILARLRASADAHRGEALEFLEQVSGLHYGFDADAWEQWVRQVTPGSE